MQFIAYSELTNMKAHISFFFPTLYQAMMHLNILTGNIRCYTELIERQHLNFLLTPALTELWLHKTIKDVFYAVNI